MPDSFAFKILLLGDSGVGKTCTTIQYVDRRFYPMYHMTIGVEYNTVWETIEDHDIQLRIWDTAGQETFRSITQSYYRNALGVIFMYDKTSPESFQHIDFWRREFLKHVHPKHKPYISMILVGNKCDQLEEKTPVVSTTEAQEWAEKHHMLFMEISAKENIRVREMFCLLAQDILKKQKEAGTLYQYKTTSSRKKTTLQPVSSSMSFKPSKSCCWSTRASI